jgi:uncharacterized membrane protein YecN with MAPEG domain
MIAIIVLLLILALFGLGGFAVHILWFVLIVALVLWVIGYFANGPPAAGSRRGWYRW